ncbi:hypothetical protein L6452_44714 [Arctium lappa]|uniref:Uncharacterized protein n=1 Tax=Arctium lappa TaxID=4217 RepID=A0ACB8XH05_ARCLA|nr:hypothetical protein L6452_44714 [Arctium lappa]
MYDSAGGLRVGELSTLYASGNIQETFPAPGIIYGVGVSGVRFDVLFVVIPALKLTQIFGKSRVPNSKNRQHQVGWVNSGYTNSNLHDSSIFVALKKKKKEEEEEEEEEET